MQIHVVGRDNVRLYEKEMRQNFRNRNQVFVKRRRWTDLARPDGLEMDDFDNDDAVHLLVLQGDDVVAGYRMHSFETGNLLTEVFPDLIERPLPGKPERMMDCTRFYSVQRAESGERRGHLTAVMFAAMMEYGLEEGADFITFVTYSHFVNMMVSLGIRIEPLGSPQKVDRWPTFAAYMHVDEATLSTLRKIAGVKGRLLTARGGCLPSVAPLPTSIRYVLTDARLHV